MLGYAIDSLETNARVILSVYDGLDPEELLWRPSTKAWSLLEILHHLWDEESGDFRMRLAHTLENPALEWPPIDPEGWVTQRDYQSKPLAKVTAGFAEARAESLDWLRSLKDPDWDSAYVHPRFGPIPAGDLLSSWVAHDLLHLRQIASNRFQFSTRKFAPFANLYAGEW